MAGGYENANDDTGAEVVKRGEVEEAGKEDDDEVVIAEEVVIADVEEAAEEEVEEEAMTEETKVPKADDKEVESVGRARAPATTRCRAVVGRVDTRKLVRGTVVGESRSSSHSLPDESLPLWSLPDESLGSPSSNESPGKQGNGSSFSHLSDTGCLRCSTCFPSPLSHWISVISVLQFGQVESFTVHFTIHFMWKR